MATFGLPSPLPRAGFSSGLFRRKTAPSGVFERPIPFHLAVITALLLASTGIANAEVGVSITGTVTDDNGSPISCAYVSVLERQVIAATDRNGRYCIADLPPGRYTLTASHIGYRSSTNRRVVVTEGVPAYAYFALHPTTLSLPPVEVTGSASVRNNWHNNRFVLTSAEWKARNIRDLGHALESIPGVTVLEGGHRQRVSIRGSPPRAVKVYLDDIPINDAGTGEAELGRINLDHLDAIVVEVDGIGGVVHLSSHDPSTLMTDGIRVELNGGRGGFHLARSGFKLEGARRGLSGLLSLGRTTERGDFPYRLDSGARGRRINNHAAKWAATGRLHATYSGWTIDGGAYWEVSSRGVPGLLHNAPTPQAQLEDRRISGSVSASSRIRCIAFRANAFVSDYTARYTSPAEQFNPTTGRIIRHFPPEDNRQTGLRWGLKADATVPGRTISLHAEYAFQADEYLGEDLLRDEITVGGVGLGAAHRSAHRLELGATIRKSRFGINWHLKPTFTTRLVVDDGAGRYFAGSPGLAFGCDKRLPAATIGLNAAFSRSIRVPPFNALFLQENMFALGNRNLKPERGEYKSAGVNLTSISGTDIEWRVAATLFRRVTRDLIIWRRNSFGKYFPDNVARVKAFGIELNGHLQPKSGVFSLAGSYVHNDARNDTPGDINRGKVPPLIARHSGSASLTLHRYGFGITFNGRWVGRRYSTESNLDPISTAGMGLAPFEVYDLVISRSFSLGGSNATIRIAVENLLDENYRVVERSPMPGRAVFGELEINFHDSFGKGRRPPR